MPESLFSFAGLRHRCFPVSFAKFLRVPFSQHTFKWLILMLIRVSWGKVRHFPLIDYNLKIKNLKKTEYNANYRKFMNRISICSLVIWQYHYQLQCLPFPGDWGKARKAKLEKLKLRHCEKWKTINKNNKNWTNIWVL